jgi:hypothetical protein
MLTYEEVSLYENARPHSAVWAPGLREHFNWELFGHSALPPVDLPEVLAAIKTPEQ